MVADSIFQDVDSFSPNVNSFFDSYPILQMKSLSTGKINTASVELIRCEPDSGNRRGDTSRLPVSFRRTKTTLSHQMTIGRRT